jgi:hypothetical protein
MHPSLVHDKTAQVILGGRNQGAAHFGSLSARLYDESLVTLHYRYGALAESFIGGAGNLGRQLGSQLAGLG